MRRQSLLWGLLGGLLALQTGLALATSQRSPSAGLAYSQVLRSRDDQQNLSRVVFRNGLTLLIEEQPQSALVSVVTYLKSGYLSEVAELRGGARLLQRVYLHHGKLGLEMGLLGAFSQGEVSGDSTLFSSIGPADNVLEMLELHATLLVPPTLDREVVDREMRILAEQNRRRMAHSRNLVRQKLLELVYPDHPASGGSNDYLYGLATSLLEGQDVLERLEALRAASYRPENTILVICGAVNRETLVETASRLYGSIPAGNASAPVETVGGEVDEVESSFQYSHQRAVLPQPYLLMAYRVPGFGQEDFLPIQLLSYMLGRGRRAILEEALSDQEVGAREVAVRLEAGRSRGWLWVTANPESTRIDRAEVAVLVELERMRRRGVPVGQLNRAKALLLKDHYLQLQSMQGRARLLARGAAVGDPGRRDGFPKRLEAISAKDVARVLENYFQRSNLTLLEYLPTQVEPRNFTAASLQETLDLLISSELEVGEDTLVPALPQSVEDFRLPAFEASYLEKELQETSILRGPQVYFKEEHRLPLVHLGIFFPGGRVHESVANAGITELLLRSLLRAGEAAAARNSQTSLESLGVEVRAVNEPDFFGFQVVTLSRHTQEVLARLLDQIRRAELEEGHLSEAQREVLAGLESKQEIVGNGLLDRARAAVFPAHPYGLARHGTPGTLGQVTLSKLRVWREGQIGDTHPLLVIRGDIEGTSFLRELVSVLSDRSLQRRAVTRVKLAAAKGRPFKTASDAEQGELVVGFRTPARERRDLAAMDVLESVLEGPGLQLSDAVRDNGVGYGLKIARQAGINAGALFIHLNTFDQGQEKAIGLLLDELGRIRQGRIRKKEFLASVVRAITDYHLLEERGEENVLELTRNLMAGVDVQILKRYRRALSRIDLGDVTSLARRYFPDPSPNPKATANAPMKD